MAYGIYKSYICPECPLFQEKMFKQSRLLIPESYEEQSVCSTHCHVLSLFKEHTLCRAEPGRASDLLLSGEYASKKSFACKTLRAEHDHEVIPSFRVSAHVGFLLFRKPFLIHRKLPEEKFSMY